MNLKNKILIPFSIATSIDAFSHMSLTSRMVPKRFPLQSPLHYSDGIDDDVSSEQFYDVTTELPIMKQVSPVSSQFESMILRQQAIDVTESSSSSSADSFISTTPAVDDATKTKMKATKTARTSKKKQVSSGLFAPAVLLTKIIIGERRFNSLRGKIIGLHSDIIAKFTKTANTTKFGTDVLKILFDAADKDRNGTIDQQELTDALGALGFNFLKDKQIAGIYKRADTNNDGKIDFDEWVVEAPKVLKNNLTKLAKQNGTAMGLMA